MQLPPLGPLSATWTPPVRAAGTPESTSPDQVILRGGSNLSPAPRTGIEAAVAWALCPAPIGLTGAELSSMASDLKARGFVLSQGRKVVSPEELTTWPEGGLQVSQRAPLAPGQLSVLPNLVDHILVSSWRELKDLTHAAREEFSAMSDPHLARTFARLEQAGVQLLVAGPDYQSREARQGVLHAKVMVIDTADPWVRDSLAFPDPAGPFQEPRMAGVYGAHREATSGSVTNVWVQGPQATRPSRLNSLETACFFHLGDPHPTLDADPLACQLRELARSGVQFLPTDSITTIAQSEDVVGVYDRLKSDPQSRFQVALDGVGWSAAPRGEDGLLQLGPDFRQAMQYRSEHLLSVPIADRKSTLEVLTVPTGQSVEAKQATFERLKAFHQAHATDQQPGQWTLWLPGGSEQYEALEDMRVLGRVVTPERPLEAMLDPFLELRQDKALSADWVANAVAWFHEHGSESRERLLELGRLGGGFGESLEAEQLLTGCGAPYPEALKAYQAVSTAIAAKNQYTRLSGTSMAGARFLELDPPEFPDEPRQNAREAFSQLLASLPPERPLDEAGESLGALIKRLGTGQAHEVFARLLEHGGGLAVATDLFLREERLAGDVETALKCLQPGGCPELPEPLEVREQAEGLLFRPEHEGVNLNAFFDRGSGTINFGAPGPPVESSLSDYRFLLGLSDRKLPEDAATLASLKKKLSTKDARSCLTELKSGQLGRLTGPELIERLQVELELQGEAKLALESLRQPPEPFEQRRQVAARIRAALGEGEVAPDYRLLTGESLPGSSFDERLEALARLRQALEPSEGLEASRQAYQAVVGSVREGAWAGRELGQATDSFLKSYLAGSLPQALKALASGPADQGQVAGGVQVSQGAVTVGGVRLRSARLL